MYQAYPQQVQVPQGPSRRHPLANAAGVVNHYIPQHQQQQQVEQQKYQYYQQPQKQQQAVPQKPLPVPQAQPQPAQKAPAGAAPAESGKTSPPLPRQNSKTAPPTPPRVIVGKHGRVQFQRVGFLGEGGFARVFEVKDKRGGRMACKVVTKDSLKTKKAKTKVLLLYLAGPFRDILCATSGTTFGRVTSFERTRYVNDVLVQAWTASTSHCYVICFEFVYRMAAIIHYLAFTAGRTYSSYPSPLYAEIKIHQSLSHPNIVRFYDCFDDDENVYMILELCPSGSLMDMLRRRRRFTEPEARFFMVQLIGACHYMHTHQVIHRDLKLGNLLLDQNMNIKVADFGLAALIENPGERKKTICGTPNYIAPEVLFDTANGHSFEVDTWSIGVILYTLVVGRPPFQTKDVKEIYKRIRDNEYEFPQGRGLSSTVQQLIQQILTTDPSKRPTLHEIIEHAFFINGPVPSYIPTSAHDVAPDFRHINKTASDSNLRRLRRYALLDEDQQTQMSQQPQDNYSLNTQKNMVNSAAQQEKDFQKAVQPGSPISALLSSARQPLLMSQADRVKENPLMRKLQAASPLRRAVLPEDEGVRVVEEEERVRKKELEAQKARIVAQMAPGKQKEEMRMSVDRENIPPARNPTVMVSAPSAASGSGSAHVLKKDFVKAREAEKMKDVRLLGRRGRMCCLRPQVSFLLLPIAPSYLGFVESLRGSSPGSTQNAYSAFNAKSQGKVFHHPDALLPLPEEKVFIVSWVDYCNKYGMGYALTDGSVGVHFNDSTTCVMSPDKLHFDYISSHRHGTVFVRKSHTLEEYPEDLKSKVYLLKHFERYIMDRLYGEYDYTFEDVDRAKGMDWVQKYLRMKHVIVFKFSHDVLQFNFYDHSKIILSSQGLLVTHIDKNYNMTRWTLTDVMTQALSGPSLDVDPDHAKFIQRLVDKLKYCKEVLVSICTQVVTVLQRKGRMLA
ncbi:hypothetical protein BDQ17DRAFT_1324325 [Cyathus striatus]|nr:hypothetical protein BDQ17DRAFT_1324325 [Cyathus striatus]